MSVAIAPSPSPCPSVPVVTPAPLTYHILSWNDLIEDNVLGYGTTGIVRLARLKADPHKKFAVKSIILDALPDDTKQHVEREVLIMQNLNHPNIAHFEGVFSDFSPLSSVKGADSAHTLHIVMEHAPCGTLAKVIEDKKENIPDSVILDWFVQLCSALHYLHSRRICHRDVKIENIFLSRRHHVKLGDFGISTTLHTHRPKANTMVGTPLSLAPEQCEGLPYDEKCDVWALGIVLFQLCSGGSPPFAADNFMALVHMIVSEPVPILDTTVRDPRFNVLCQAMLQKDPKKRPTIEDILRNYIRLSESHPSHPNQDPSHSRALQRMCGPKEIFKKQERDLKKQKDSSPSTPGLQKSAEKNGSGQRNR